MSTIIQAGHKSSKSKQLMEKLYERGLSRPNDSYTHKMTPEQVSETLYKVLSREDMSSTNEKMADNIMIDLLLANLDSENWGWESDKNLASLEYWGQTEPDVRFILVFDHPSNILKELADVTLTSDIIDQAMNEWVVYHQKILSFLKNNDEKTILIEGAGAVNNINDLSKEVRNIASSLQLKSSWQVLSTTDQKITVNADLNDKTDVVMELLAIEVLRKYPEVIKIFNLMLDKASVKHSDQIYKTKNIDLNKLIQALNQTKNLKITGSDLNKKEGLFLREKQDLENKFSDLEKLVDHYKNENNELKAHMGNYIEKGKKDLEIKSLKNKEELESYKNDLYNLKNEKKTFELKEENEILLKQLHWTQEELERTYIKKQKLESSKVSQESNQVIIKGGKDKGCFGAADRVKKDLPYLLGSRIVEARNPKKLAVLPIALTQEYRKFQKYEKKQSNLPSIDSYQDLQDAEKVKKHLSYRLGSILVESFSSPKGLVLLPIKLGAEIALFKK